MSIPKIASKLVGDKKRWRQYKARTRELPDSYRAAVEALGGYDTARSGEVVDLDARPDPA